MTSFTDSIASELDGLTGCNPGPASCCAECVDQLGYESADEMREAEDAGTVVDEGGFSGSSCDSCGSSLAGDRYIAHAFDVDKEAVHLSICIDCLMFHANGDEPDRWDG